MPSIHGFILTNETNKLKLNHKNCLAYSRLFLKKKMRRVDIFYHHRLIF